MEGYDWSSASQRVSLRTVRPVVWHAHNVTEDQRITPHQPGMEPLDAQFLFGLRQILNEQMTRGEVDSSSGID